MGKYFVSCFIFFGLIFFTTGNTYGMPLLEDCGPGKKLSTGKVIHVQKKKPIQKKPAPPKPKPPAPNPPAPVSKDGVNKIVYTTTGFEIWLDKKNTHMLANYGLLGGGTYIAAILKETSEKVVTALIGKIISDFGVVELPAIRMIFNHGKPAPMITTQ